MAGPWYVDSAAAGTADGLSWVNACTSIANILAKAVVAGDTIYVRSTHSESTAVAVAWTFPGTVAAPNRVICATNANQPPLAANVIPAAGSTTPGGGAAVATTGASNLTINGSVYFRGMTFNVGSGNNTASYLGGNDANSIQKFELCQINLVSTGAASRLIPMNNGAPSVVDMLNTSISFGSTSQLMRILSSGVFRWRGQGSAVAAGAATPTKLFIANLNAAGGVISFEDVDLSIFGAGTSLYDQSSSGYEVRFINCKLGASVSVVTATPLANWLGRVDLTNSDSGATNYRSERYDYCGTQKTSTTVYNNATDGTTPISWQLVTTANAQPQWPFECVSIVQWVTAGTYAATTIQCTSATAALTNADIWVEAEYLGSALTPEGSIASSGITTPLTAGSPLAAGTWAHGGLGNNYQLVLPSFTTAMAGYVRFIVKVAKATLTINVDPAVTVA